MRSVFDVMGDLEVSVLKGYLGDRNEAEKVVVYSLEQAKRFTMRENTPFEFRDDFIQSTATKVFLMMQDYPHRGHYNPYGGATFNTWLWTVMRNDNLSWYRKANRNPLHKKIDQTDDGFDILDIIPSKEPSVEEKMISKENIISMEEILKNLNPTYRNVIQLRAQGLKYEEISERTGLNEGTVKSRINRGREEARQYRQLVS